MSSTLLVAPAKSKLGHDYLQLLLGVEKEAMQLLHHQGDNYYNPRPSLCTNIILCA